MTVYGSKNLTWFENSLWFKNNLMYSVVPDNVNKHLYRVKWLDGVLSEDSYNLTRAKNSCVRMALTDLNEEDLRIVDMQETDVAGR